MKKNILLFVLGLIIAGSIGVYAGTKISANQITYTDSNNVEKTVDTVLDDLYTKADKGVIAVAHTYKNAASWGYDGLSNIPYKKSDYVQWTSNNGYYYIKVLKTCKLKITGVMKNGHALSSAPKYDLYKNSTKVFSFTGGTASGANTTQSKTIDVNANDQFYLAIYGGGETTYYITIFEII